jgi:hypothetical protein
MDGGCMRHFREGSWLKASVAGLVCVCFLLISGQLQAERNKEIESSDELAGQKVLNAELVQLAAGCRHVEAEPQKLTMGKRPSGDTKSMTGRNGRFIAYRQGIVLDTKTNLMWAAADNGRAIDWRSAKSYCDTYRGGGYTDWRMPTRDELAGLYDAGKTQRNEVIPSMPMHLTELIALSSCCIWAAEAQGSGAAYFDFNGGHSHWTPNSRDDAGQALPVRSGK